jgi:hypothetical protein
MSGGLREGRISSRSASMQSETIEVSFDEE